MPTTITLDGARRPGRWNVFSAFRGADDRGRWLGRPRTARGACPTGCWPERQDGRIVCVCADTLATQRLRGLGDAWSDGTAPSPLADFTASLIGWGILAFAAGTVAHRGYGAIKKRL